MREVSSGDTIMLSNADQHKIYALNNSENSAQPLESLIDNSKDNIIQLGNDSYDRHNEVSLILIECGYDKEIVRPILSVLPAMLPGLNAESNSRFKVIDVEVRLLTLESQFERMGRTAVVNHWASIMLIECLRTYIESLPEATDSWLQALRNPYLAKALAVMHRWPERS